MPINLGTPIKQLPRIGTITTKALTKLGISTVQDLLFYFPYKYLDFSKFSSIKDIRPGQTITLRVTIKTIQKRFSFTSHRSLAEAIVSDATGSVKVIWFNQPYIADYLKTGDEVLLSGKAEIYKTLQLANPVYEKMSEDTIHTGRLVPVYHITEGLYHKTIRTVIKQVLPEAASVTELLPDDIRAQYDLLHIQDTLRQIHFPDSEAQLERAKFRVTFEQALLQQLAVQQHKALLKTLPAPKIAPDIELVKSFLTTLPFVLTNGQKRALWDILQDMEIKHPMHRLLEGDVGSGKTLVAIVTALTAVRQAFQVVVLAPTEILAKQHATTFRALLQQLPPPPVRLGLLTNHYHDIDAQKTTKAKLLAALAAGSIDILIGTHAVLADGVVFKNLGLVIIDEQHRFGVAQRSLLLKHWEGNQTAAHTPHLLSMTATPIPRTLAIAAYGDLDISTLKELPKGRQKITSTIIAPDQRNEAYTFIQKEITAGRQAFIITPRVEEGELSESKSVKKEFERLRTTVFRKQRVGLLYGSMKGADKEKTMQAFNNHELDILVATSVIEIGIDVPNATVMLIEGAEHFGLAQLHQLRGRVGRGQFRSYCLLCTETTDEKTRERLEVFCRSADGFQLAELDLQQRGFGSLFGTAQTGFDFTFSRYLTLKTLELAKEAAQTLIKEDLYLHQYPLLKQKVAPLTEQVHLE
jgi:ATP-dependent DNA helicase RecG